MVAQTTGEAGLLGKSDADQLAFAAERQMTLVTHNRVDFEKLGEAYRVAGKKHGGIIVAVRRTPHEVARRLLVFLDQYTADEMEDQIFYI